MSDNIPATSVRVIEAQELREKIPSLGSADDKELGRACEIASMAIETLCGKTKFIQRTFSEDYSGGHNGRLGGARRIYLNALPIVSVTSITDDDANTVASTEYVIVDKEGYLEHDTYWPVPVGRWTIVYVAGYWTKPSDVDWDVKEWARVVALRNKGFKGDSIQSTSLSGRAGSRSVSRSQAGVASRTELESSMIAKYRRRSV
jgi:hypothetical protein